MAVTVINCPNCACTMFSGDCCPECEHVDAEGCDCYYCVHEKPYEGTEDQ